MIEKIASEISEVSTEQKASENFNPDKRVDVSSSEFDSKEKSDSDFDSKNSFAPDKRVDNSTTEINPYGNIPKDGPRGNWDGAPGDSKYIPDEKNLGGPPSGLDAKNALSETGVDGIEYNHGEPDFSEVAEETVEIKDMSEVRYGSDGNFAKADQALADRYNSENHADRNNWTPREIKEYRQENNLTWHERQDCKNMDLVNRDIHQYFTHTGGVAFCKARGNSEVKFDE